MYWLKIDKLFLFTIVLFVFFFSATINLSAKETNINAKEILPKINTSIIYDGSSKVYDNNIKLLKAEILELTSGEFNVTFKPSSIINGQWDSEIIRAEVKKAVESPETDFIICIGIMASHEICKYKELEKPVIATSIVDTKLQNIASVNNKSGIKNLNFLVSTGSFMQNLELFQQVKYFKTLTVIINRKISKDLPFIDSFFAEENKSFPFNIKKIYSDNTAESVLSQLSENTEAILFTPMLRFSEPEFIKIINGINKMKLPGFTVVGKSEVASGLLAGLTPGTESKTIIRRIALNFQRILLGEKPENLSTIFSKKRKLVINMNTAELTGIYPSSTVIFNAEIINKTISQDKIKFTLGSVIQEVIAKNIEIEQGRAMVAAGSQDVKKARSYLIPNIEASLTGLKIDKNTAEISFGTESEESWKGSLKATQVIFSEKAWSGWKAVKHGQKFKEEELNSILLDISFASGNAYINILKVLSLERVKKNSLDLTKANLKRARLRLSVGTAGASEVYRWESKIAQQKKELLKVRAKIRQAKNNLNRLLNHPLNEDFIVEDIKISNPVFCVNDNNLEETINNPLRYNSLKNFMVKKGLQASPELKGLESAIKAKERLCLSARRDFFLPSVALQGKVTEVYDRNGFDQTTDKRDKTSWSLALNASFPLFTGGAKSADYIKAKEESRKLKLAKSLAKAKIEEKILYTMEAAKASYGAIKHSKDAAIAAGKNLNLVTDAYTRGVISIIELLDAQNASTMADLGAENSVYDFMADLLSVQRSIAKLDFSKPADAKKAFHDEFYEYIK